MKKIALFAALFMVAVTAYATREDDITKEGVSSWFGANVTASRLHAMIRDTEDSTAVNTLAESECGKTIFLNSATEFETTLPAPSDGCYFKFIVKAAPSSADYTVVTNGSDNIIIGGVNELEVDTSDDGPYDADADTLTFVDGVGVVGDYVEMISDGTSWYITGQANADGGITVTKAS